MREDTQVFLHEGGVGRRRVGQYKYGDGRTVGPDAEAHAVDGSKRIARELMNSNPRVNDDLFGERSGR